MFRAWRPPTARLLRATLCPPLLPVGRQESATKDTPADRSRSGGDGATFVGKRTNAAAHTSPIPSSAGVSFPTPSVHTSASTPPPARSRLAELRHQPSR